MSDEREIIDRKMAIAMGLTRYFTGKPCRWGHVAERNIFNLGCMECVHERDRRRTVAMRERRLIDCPKPSLSDRREKRRAYENQYYAANRERLNEYKRRYDMANREMIREISRRHRENMRTAMLALKQLGITLKGDSNATC